METRVERAATLEEAQSTAATTLKSMGYRVVRTLLAKWQGNLFYEDPDALVYSEVRR